MGEMITCRTGYVLLAALFAFPFSFAPSTSAVLVVVRVCVCVCVSVRCSVGFFKWVVKGNESISVFLTFSLSLCSLCHSFAALLPFCSSWKGYVLVCECVCMCVFKSFEFSRSFCCFYVLLLVRCTAMKGTKKKNRKAWRWTKWKGGREKLGCKMMFRENEIFMLSLFLPPFPFCIPSLILGSYLFPSVSLSFPVICLGSL